MSGTKPACIHCGTTTEELRPYGPGGAPVCYPCGTDPAHLADTEAAFGALLGAAAAMSNVVHLTPNGPSPDMPQGAP